MTTFNGADRVDNQIANYFGRPNTWGMRYSNILLQQADVIAALGTRLGMQQTGFNWQEFAPLAHLIQVEIDPSELNKGHPRVDEPCCGDANEVLRRLMVDHSAVLQPHQNEWLEHCRVVKSALPLSEEVIAVIRTLLIPTTSGFSSPQNSMLTRCWFPAVAVHRLLFVPGSYPAGRSTDAE